MLQVAYNIIETRDSKFTLRLYDFVLTFEIILICGATIKQADRAPRCPHLTRSSWALDQEPLIWFSPYIPFTSKAKIGCG